MGSLGIGRLLLMCQGGGGSPHCMKWSFHAPQRGGFHPGTAWMDLPQGRAEGMERILTKTFWSGF